MTKSQIKHTAKARKDQFSNRQELSKYKNRDDYRNIILQKVLLLKNRVVQTRQ